MAEEILRVERMCKHYGDLQVLDYVESIVDQGRGGRPHWSQWSGQEHPDPLHQSH